MTITSLTHIQPDNFPSWQHFLENDFFIEPLERRDPRSDSRVDLVQDFTLVHESARAVDSNSPLIQRDANGNRVVNLRQLGLRLSNGDEAPEGEIPFEQAWARSSALRTAILAQVALQNDTYAPVSDFGGTKPITAAAIIAAFEDQRAFTLPEYEQRLSHLPESVRALIDQSPFWQARIEAARTAEQEGSEARTTLIVAEGATHGESQGRLTTENGRFANEGGWNPSRSHLDHSARIASAAVRAASGNQTDTSTDFRVYGSSIYGRLPETLERDPNGRFRLEDTNIPQLIGSTSGAVTVSMSETLVPNGNGITRPPREMLPALERAYDVLDNAQRSTILVSGSNNSPLGSERGDVVSQSYHLGIMTSIGDTRMDEADGRPGDRLDRMVGMYMHRTQATGGVDVAFNQNHDVGERWANGSSAITPQVAGYVDELRARYPDVPEGAIIYAVLRSADPVGDRRTTNAAGFQWDAQNGAGRFDPTGAAAFNQDASSAESLIQAWRADPSLRIAEYREERLFSQVDSSATQAIAPMERAQMQASGHAISQQAQTASFPPLQGISGYTQGADGRLNPEVTNATPAPIDVRFARYSIEFSVASTDRSTWPDLYFRSPQGTVLDWNAARDTLHVEPDGQGRFRVSGIFRAPQLVEEHTATQGAGSVVLSPRSDTTAQLTSATQEFFGPEQGAAYNPIRHASTLREAPRQELAHRTTGSPEYIRPEPTRAPEAIIKPTPTTGSGSGNITPNEPEPESEPTPLPAAPAGSRSSSTRQSNGRVGGH